MKPKVKARKQALIIWEKERNKAFNKRGVNLMDDRSQADGILNTNETWDML